MNKAISFCLGIVTITVAGIVDRDLQGCGDTKLTNSLKGLLMLATLMLVMPLSSVVCESTINTNINNYIYIILTLSSFTILILASIMLSGDGNCGGLSSKGKNGLIVLIVLSFLTGFFNAYIVYKKSKPKQVSHSFAWGQDLSGLSGQESSGMAWG
jgi:hypothetical protein